MYIHFILNNFANPKLFSIFVTLNKRVADREQ